MINHTIEILGTTLLFLLNPVTWAIVISVSVCTQRFLIPTIFGVIAQIASLIPLAFYFDTISEARSVYGYGLLDGEGVESSVLLTSAPVLSGIMIAAIVILFVRQRRAHQLEGVVNKSQISEVDEQSESVHYGAQYLGVFDNDNTSPSITNF